ncbi:MAG: SDR family oxidoreductase [Thermoleophilia bacterium]
MSMPLAVVTGASSGIGLAAARALCADGFRVTLVARREDRLREAVDALTAAHGAGAARWHVADVSDPGAVHGLAERLGAVDALVNNAGIDGEGIPVGGLGLDHWRRVLEVNVTAALALSQALVPGMPAGASIVNVSSINGLVSEYGYADYNTSKGALNALTRSMATDLAGQGIRSEHMAALATLTEIMTTPLGSREAGEASRPTSPGPGGHPRRRWRR